MKRKLPLFTKFNLWFVVIVIASMFVSAELMAHGMSTAEKNSIINGGLGAYLWLGATHMLTGYDHLLFVFGVVFLLSRFMDVVKYVTGFTIGHTITLIAATYMGLKVNYLLIDAAIALSVCYIAFVNIGGFKKYFAMSAPNLLATVVIIGLVHGVGLSTRLQDLPLDQSQLLLQIISFNVGVELGQIAALAIMLVVIKVFRGLFVERSFLVASQMFLIIAGGLLFLMQMHTYMHLSYPDEHGFNQDAHFHKHLDMNQKKQQQIDVNKKTHHESL
ncbi:hypothetical protein MNBD_GAMMA12-249 [hydrothermal vent metagenome]|uniref:HupE / UreJ protein n=1 Tax=hydrothermal vent metagenome TaxID=652676 RepID=A0A3B0YNF8_9ZZZZ